MRVEIYGSAKMILGDSSQVMPTLGQFDAVVTDPPYGIGADAHMHKNSGKQYGNAAAPKAEYKKTNWDDRPCSPAMIEMMMGQSKHQIIFGGNYFELPPTSCWLVWDKENGQNNFADCELAWSNLPKAVRLKRHMWNGMLRKGDEPRHGHPTQKPLEVMKWCLSHLPKKSKTIIDPFAGSATTGVADMQMGLDFVGIEADEDYFELACRRLQDEHNQLKLF